MNLEDNVWLKSKFITDANYNLITTGNSVKLFENQPTTKIFHFIGTDWNNNKQDITVKVHFKVPTIQIVDVNSDEWIIKAKISHPMGESAVKFYVNQNGKLIPLKTLTNQEVFTGWITQFVFTWAIFKPNKTVTLYASTGNPIGNLNLETGIIKVNSPYKVYWVSKNGLLYLFVEKPINEVQYEPIFEIYIPSEKLVTAPEMLNTSKFELKQFTNANLGEFSDSYCIFDKQAKTCAIYIQKQSGKIYIDPDYHFVAKYLPNEVWVVTYEFYDLPIVDTNLFSSATKIFRVSIKPKNLLKK